MNTLRELRLWHWNKVLSYRERARKFEKDVEDWEKVHVGFVCRHSRIQAKNAHREANRHLGAVQALNDCFPVGDTVEGDASRAKGGLLPA